MQKIPGGHFYGQFWQAFPKGRPTPKGYYIQKIPGRAEAWENFLGALRAQILQCVGTGGWLSERCMHRCRPINHISVAPGRARAACWRGGGRQAPGWEPGCQAAPRRRATTM